MTASLAALSEAEFVAIRSVVMGTERGRRFLVEYARRRRAEDAARILDAIDRIEAHALRNDAERARQRQDGERAAEVVRQLAQVLEDLRPLANARVRAQVMDAGEPRRETVKAGGLERRFAGLVALDEQDIEHGFKLFG